jgi:hypothetical protein
VDLLLLALCIQTARPSNKVVTSAVMIYIIRGLATNGGKRSKHYGLEPSSF